MTMTLRLGAAAVLLASTAAAAQPAGPAAMSPKEVIARHMQEARATWLKTFRIQEATRHKGRPADHAVPAERTGA